MSDLLTCRTDSRRKWLALLLALALAVNFVRPAAGLPAKDGYLPICTGSTIVYVPLAELGLDLPTHDRPDPPSEPCPWSALSHAVEVAPAAVAPRTVAYTRAPALAAGRTASDQATSSSFQARAPPCRAAEDSRDI